MSTPCRSILLVEDDPGHARLITKNLQRAGVSNSIVWMDDGQRAVDWLLPQGESPQKPLPGLVLLDLNLPGLDGLQVLARIRGDARTRELPVAILTTSDQPGEIGQCHQLGCNRFLRKPIANEQFADTVASILQLLTETAAAQTAAGASSLDQTNRTRSLPRGGP